MRRWIAAIIIVLVSVNFYLSIKRKQPVVKNKMDVSYMLEEIKQNIDEDYPSNPLEVVNIHNRLMDILYGKELADEEVELVAHLQRKLYWEKLLLLNPEDKQLEEIKNELLLNKEKNTKVISSKVIESRYNTSENFIAKVIHYTNKEDILRKYILKEEFNEGPNNQKQWKIYGWKELGSSKAQEEE